MTETPATRFRRAMYNLRNVTQGFISGHKTLEQLTIALEAFDRSEDELKKDQNSSRRGMQ